MKNTLVANVFDWSKGEQVVTFSNRKAGIR